MSVFQFPATRAAGINVEITDTAATTVVDASNTAAYVAWFEVNETAGGTQNLTVDIYDGSDAAVLGDDAGAVWSTAAVTADTSYKFTQGYVIPKGSKLRVTSTATGGDFHVHGLRVLQD